MAKASRKTREGGRTGLTRRTLAKRPVKKKKGNEDMHVGEPQIGPRLDEA